MIALKPTHLPRSGWVAATLLLRPVYPPVCHISFCQNTLPSALSPAWYARLHFDMLRNLVPLNFSVLFPQLMIHNIFILIFYI